MLLCMHGCTFRTEIKMFYIFLMIANRFIDIVSAVKAKHIIFILLLRCPNKVIAVGEQSKTRVTHIM